MVEEGSIKADLTETQGLELVLGVGERCTVTSAIQRPGSGHLRGSDSGETSIIVSKARKGSWSRAVGLRSSFPLSSSLTVDCLTTPRLFPLSAPAAHAQQPLSLSISINRVRAGRKQSADDDERCLSNQKPDATDLAVTYIWRARPLSTRITFRKCISQLLLMCILYNCKIIKYSLKTFLRSMQQKTKHHHF